MNEKEEEKETGEETKKEQGKEVQEEADKEVEKDVMDWTLVTRSKKQRRKTVPDLRQSGWIQNDRDGNGVERQVE